MESRLSTLALNVFAMEAPDVPPSPWIGQPDQLIQVANFARCAQEVFLHMLGDSGALQGIGAVQALVHFVLEHEPHLAATTI